MSMIKSNTIVKGNIGSMRFNPAANTKFGIRPVINMSIAEHDGDQTVWYNTAFFGKDAEKLNASCRVGDFVAVEGDISESKREYQGKVYTNLDIRPTRISRVAGSKVDL